MTQSGAFSSDSHDAEQSRVQFMPRPLLNIRMENLSQLILMSKYILQDLRGKNKGTDMFSPMCASMRTEVIGP